MIFSWPERVQFFGVTVLYSSSQVLLCHHKHPHNEIIIMTTNSTTVRDPMDTAVCLCSKIRKKAFGADVTEKQLFTIEQVREETTANTGCGCCYETVIGIIDEVKASS